MGPTVKHCHRRSRGCFIPPWLLWILRHSSGIRKQPTPVLGVINSATSSPQISKTVPIFKSLYHFTHTYTWALIINTYTLQNICANLGWNIQSLEPSGRGANTQGTLGMCLPWSLYFRIIITLPGRHNRLHSTQGTWPGDRSGSVILLKSPAHERVRLV